MGGRAGHVAGASEAPGPGGVVPAGGGGAVPASGGDPHRPDGAGAFGRDTALASLAIARRFVAGATMWCVSPPWPWHARHVAVEFVHPVIVGKRALPAVAVDDPDVVDALRLKSRRPDIVVAIAAPDDEAVVTLMRHARVWGLLTVWIGAGSARPEPGAADHVLWSDDDDDEVAAVFGGGVVLTYHLLWELVQVCFEHPGLLTGAPEDGGGEVCVTCSDEGRVGEVLAVLPGHRASVRTAAGVEDVDASLIDVPARGALVLLHAGSAVATVEGSPR